MMNHVIRVFLARPPAEALVPALDQIDRLFPAVRLFPVPFQKCGFAGIVAKKRPAGKPIGFRVATECGIRWPLRQHC